VARIEKEMSTRAIKVVVWSLAGAFVLLFLVLAIMRLAYPYEVEWMEGSMLEHSLRILSGKPIYTAPSIEFVAWLYPPLYYFAVALSMKLFGIGFFAGRIVSVVSAILTASLLAIIVRHITRRTDLAVLTAALFLATYHLTGFYFDIARNDAFFTLLLVAAALSAIRTRGVLGAVLTAVLLSLAFLTKQQAIFFFPAVAMWFWLQARRNAVIFSAAALSATLLALVLWNGASNGWLFYYLFAIPSAKRADFSILRAIEAIPHYALGPLAISIVALCFVLQRNRLTIFKTPSGLLILMSLAALIAGAISLGNDGGDANVMMPFAAFTVTMIPVALGMVVERPLVNAGWLAMALQFAALYFNPLSEKMLIASAHQRLGGDAFMQKLQTIPGEVYFPYHSFIARQAGKPTQANILATLDVLRLQDTTAKRLQRDLDSAFARHRFSAVIMEENPMVPVDSVAHYTLAGRMLDEPNVFLTRFGPSATRPQYIYLPK
jgi:4-amino-4-deoxy-L-arabinose transferase-like glycosyltransferase